ncbi:PDZ domain-containing protein [Streptomyces chromofuscus]|uniref:PDZ domain-containing protein n=1 Tax=Streptomyces chromofuscus TaxID=42881 RepID=A0A7M2T6U6_STRCW|nr:PDZ domain-containing protein [Streptomyces chromofuscus]QOV43633.1 PDZ domain-containing protein [Streptomyces chromofuscus]GGT11045.1 PDZ domain-containing protein [Streptomyces chromofuscus]
MEQTALRPKPIPGREPDGTGSGPVRRPHAARRRGRRLTTLLVGLLAGTVLVLSGVGLGTVAATVIGTSKLAEQHREPGRTGTAAPVSPGHPSAGPGPSSAGPRATAPTPSADMVMGVEVVDAEKSGALVVGVHVPGPGYTAGLVRGDVLLTFDGAPIESAADLVRAVDRARPGARVLVTVRHESGGYQQLAVTPGILA